jgi:hypothetical protein
MPRSQRLLGLKCGSSAPDGLIQTGEAVNLAENTRGREVGKASRVPFNTNKGGTT